MLKNTEEEKVPHKSESWLYLLRNGNEMRTGSQYFENSQQDFHIFFRVCCYIELKCIELKIRSRRHFREYLKLFNFLMDIKLL